MWNLMIWILRVILVGLGLAALTWLGSMAWDVIFLRMRRWQIHQVKLGALRHKAAMAAFKQLATDPNGRGGWVLTSTGDILHDLDSPAERILLAASRASRATQAQVLNQDPELVDPDPVPQLPEYLPSDKVIRGQQLTYRSLILGMGPDGLVQAGMDKLVHLAVGGSSGWGKSMMLRWVAYQLAKSVDMVQLALVDLEGVTLAPFETCARTLWPVAESGAGALRLAQALTDELDHRKDLFTQFRDQGVDSLAAYNSLADQPLSPIVLIADEMSALLEDAKVVDAFRPLIFRSRKYGIWNVWGGQDWKAGTMPTAVRNQFSSRMHFHAMSSSQSRVLLGMPGAEHLTTAGRALAVLPGRPPIEFQAPILGDNDIRSIMGNGPVNDWPDWHPPGGWDNAADEWDAEQATLYDQVKDALAAGADNPTAICRHLKMSAGGQNWYKIKDILATIQEMEPRA